jgi:RNA polymerase sigma-70 factor (ECF subfamily)
MEREVPVPAAGLDDATLDRLVVEARTGSGPAFTRLWEAFAPAVAGYLRARGIREVEDVTSEVFLSAFGSIRRFEGGAQDFRGWLFTIAHHRGVDERRRRGRVAEVPLEGTDTAAGASAETEALAGAGDRVLPMLDLLPEDQRDVLLLRVIAGLPVQQVASTLERSPGAVRQLQHRALSRLRRELRPDRAPVPVTGGLP